jgi:glycine oxidase
VVTPDVVVVGGGVVGLAVAEELAASGRRVVVLERDRVGETCAAAAAAGMLAPAAEADATPPVTTQLALESHRMYPEWVARLESASGMSVGFDRSGTVVVGLDADDLRELVHLEQAQRRFGLRTRRLSAAEARDLQPSLGPSVVGGLLLEDDWQVDPRRLLQALQRSLEARGGRVVEGAEVRSLRRKDGTWRVSTRGGDEVAARTVVVAAGAWTPQVLPADAGPPLPVRPVRGAVLRLGAGLETARVVRTPRVYVVPRAWGETVVGATVEERGWAREALAGGVYELLRESRRALPCVDEMPLREVAVGFRPAIRDNVPAVGAWDDDRTLFVATGHYRKGVELAPLTAAVLRRLLDGGDHPLSSHVDPRRFGRAA